MRSKRAVQSKDMSERREHMSEQKSKWLSTLRVESAHDGTNNDSDGKGDDGNLDIRRKSYDGHAIKETKFPGRYAARCLQGIVTNRGQYPIEYRGEIAPVHSFIHLNISFEQPRNGT